MTDALLEDAEKLVDAAWDALDAGDPEHARAIAEEALSFTSGAIDGYIILGEISQAPAVRIALLREGVRQGQRIYAAAFKPPRSIDFWLELRTRPYMRCACALAVELWRRAEAGDRAEALGLVRHLLKINPTDNQGIRFLAWNWLAEAGAWDELTRILRRYRGEARTETRYCWALDAWRRHDAAAPDILKQAIVLNPHVPALLLQPRAPVSLDEHVTFQSRSEAIAYAMHAHAVWRAAPGAIEWLAQQARDARPA